MTRAGSTIMCILSVPDGLAQCEAAGETQDLPLAHPTPHLQRL